MIASLRFAQTVRTGAGLGFEQARKAFRRVEVEVLLGDDPFQVEKVLQVDDGLICSSEMVE